MLVYLEPLPPVIHTGIGCRAVEQVVTRQAVSRDDILTAVWETADFYSSRSLDVFITKLRKYLSQDTTVTLKSLKGVGVCLED